MAAPILWAPVIFCFFLQENPHAHKIPRFGGSWTFLGGGGSANFTFTGAGIFLNYGPRGGGMAGVDAVGTVEPYNMQNCNEYKSWRILLGVLPQNEENKSGDKIRTKSGGSKIKICERSALPKTGPKR